MPSSGSTGSATLAASAAPLATAASRLFPYSGTVVALVGIFAMLSAMNTYIVAASRVVHSVAVEYHIKGLALLNRQGTPGSALVLCCGVTALMLFFSNEFSRLAILSVITILVPYIFFCIGACITFREKSRIIFSGSGALVPLIILILFFLLHEARHRGNLPATPSVPGGGQIPPAPPPGRRPYLFSCLRLTTYARTPMLIQPAPATIALMSRKNARATQLARPSTGV